MVCDVVALEQGFVDGLFGVLDARVRVAQERLVAVQLQGDDVDALVEREVEYHGLVGRLDELRVAELGLVFGRLDMVGGECRYVGRVGLVDDGGRVLLVDWRAPMARPFYVATTAQPVGVERRRGGRGGRIMRCGGCLRIFWRGWLVSPRCFGRCGRLGLGVWGRLCRRFSGSRM